MLYRIKTVDGVKTKVPLAGSTPAGLPVGSILTTYKKIQPYNYLYCDGSTFDETQYPELYLYLGTNVLPDYRECVPVGAEKNTTDIFDSTETNPSTGLPGTQSHDVFTQGEFKDDQIQNITGNIQISATKQNFGGALYGDDYYWATAASGGNSTNIKFDASRVARAGTTTRTKEKAVYYYIKAVDGVDIADEDTFLNTVVNTIQDSQSYSTTEQKTGGTWIDEKPIYRKVVDLGNLHNATTKSVSHGISNIGLVTDLRGIWYASNDYRTLPYVGGGATYDVYLSADNTNIKVQTGMDRSSFTGFAIIEYTKNE